MLALLGTFALACTSDDGAVMDGGSSGSSGTTGVEAVQYRPCPAGADDCEDPAPLCFAPLTSCSKVCAVDETCPPAPPPGTGAPRCAIMEFAATQYQACVLACTTDTDCPEGMSCQPLDECTDCDSSICQVR